MRTTITIPDSLATEVDALVGQNGITTRNQFILEALDYWVRLKREEAIDSEFARMAEDPDYIAETLSIESEFEASDWEVAATNND